MAGFEYFSCIIVPDISIPTLWKHSENIEGAKECIGGLNQNFQRDKGIEIEKPSVGARGVWILSGTTQFKTFCTCPNCTTLKLNCNNTWHRYFFVSMHYTVQVVLIVCFFFNSGPPSLVVGESGGVKLYTAAQNTGKCLLLELYYSYNVHCKQ